MNLSRRKTQSGSIANLAPYPVPAPDRFDVEFLASTFDNDLADFVQGYAPLGWEGWEM